MGKRSPDSGQNHVRVERPDVPLAWWPHEGWMRVYMIHMLLLGFGLCASGFGGWEECYQEVVWSVGGVEGVPEL